MKPQIALEKMMELYEDLETLLKGYDDINLDTQLSKAYKDFNDSFEIVQKALEDLELYKKAFEIATKNNKYEMLVIKRQARKEIKNG